MIYPEHPFVVIDEEMTIDQMSDKISELYKKLNIAQRTSNIYLYNQILMALTTYQTKYNEKLRGKDSGDFDSIIDIS